MTLVAKTSSAADTLRQMIDGESSLDLLNGRRCASELCDDGALEELVGALEVLDTALTFRAPVKMVCSLRDEAKRKLMQATAQH